MSKKWIYAAVPLLLVVGLTVVYVVKPAGQHTEAMTSAAPARPTMISASPDVLRYPAGAPRLVMIRSQVLPASPLPLSPEPLSARIVYDEDATARISVPVSGRIVALKAAPGDVVSAGQVLAEVDAPDLGLAQSDLDKANADENRKKLTLERAKELGPGEAIAAKDVEQATADYAQAKAETQRAERRLKNLNPRGLTLSGQRMGLVSPLSGVVAERNVSPAMEVGPSLTAPLFVVTDLSRLWLLLDLPESLLARVKQGGTVEVESDAYPGERFPAKIAQLGQTVDPNSRRVVVRARLSNPNAKLLPEMFVRAYVLQSQGMGVRVPNEAIVNRGIYSYVFVQVALGEFHRQKVQLLARGSDASYVGDGLKGGESIVISGALLLDAEMADQAGDQP
jgi:cobalt-zinc-cadmium efflux system membrane fusion protein